jgi:hypothetical protein
MATTIYTQYAPSDAIYINNLLTISQNVDVYGQHLMEREFDYTFRINVSELVAAGSTNGITSLFSNATFTQNTLNVEDYNVNLTLPDHSTFANWGTLFNNANTTTVIQGLSSTNFGTFNAVAREKIGDRLLEVIAHKLFGHAQAHAAIKNDTSFYTHDNELWDHLCSSVATTSFRKDIFNQYVKLGRYNTSSTSGAGTSGNDVGGNVHFNFADITIDFPLQLNGHMIFDTSLTEADKTLLKLGPDVGGSRLTDGNYDVPILIRFHT